MITKRLTIVASLILGLTILSPLSATPPVKTAAPAKNATPAKNTVPAKKGLAKYADKAALIAVLEKEINNVKSKLTAAEKKILEAFKDGLKAASLTKLTCVSYFARLQTEGKKFLFKLLDSTDLKAVVELWPDFEKLMKSA